MLTPDDIRNPARKSGFDHVSYSSTEKSPAKKPYQVDVYGGKNDKSGRSWKGKRRATALEAAQDYCDYVNGLDVELPASLNYPGHETRSKSAIQPDEEVEAALGVLRDFRAQQEGKQGYVYLIGVEGDNYGVKIGYSLKPPARCGELQTGNPRKLYLLAQFEGTLEDERAIHARHIANNLIGEWFIPTPALFAEFGLTWPIPERHLVGTAYVNEDFELLSVGLSFRNINEPYAPVVVKSND